MNAFEFEIKRARGRKPNNKMNGKYLYPWQYKTELYPDEDFNRLVNSYQSWVFICSSRNAAMVASTPLRLYVAKNNKKAIKGYQTKGVNRQTENYIRSDYSSGSLKSVRKAFSFEEVLDHPFHDLMSSVNNFQNKFDLWEHTDIFQELTGNAFWYILKNKLGVPKEIWLLPPQNTKIIPSKESFISGYKYQKFDQEVDLEESEVIHFKFPNPKSQYFGHSPLAAIWPVFEIDRKISLYENSVLDNGANLTGMFQTEEELAEHEFLRLKSEISEAFSGYHNAGKSPLLEKGVKFVPIMLPPKEISFLNGRKAIKEQVANCYGQSLGLYDREANRANAIEANKSWMTQGIRPRLIRLEEKLNEKLMPMYDESLFVKFDNPVEQDREFELDKRVRHVLSGLTSIDEERVLMNYDPLGEGFDKPLIPVNMSTIENIIAGKEGNAVPDVEKMKFLLYGNRDRQEIEEIKREMSKMYSKKDAQGSIDDLRNYVTELIQEKNN